MVPDYQTFMRPLLALLSNEKELAVKDMYEAMAVRFKLTSADRALRIPTGTQSLLDNRVGWAKTYLKMAGLVESPRRGFVKITQKGKEALGTDADIRTKFLHQFPDFKKFQNRSTTSDQPVSEPEIESNQTPEETLESSYRTIRSALADELLAKVKEMSPERFEKLVVDLLVQMGYGGSRLDAGQAIGRSGDEGIDGIIKEDRLGLDVIYIQAQRWEGVVSRPEIQKFAGALQGQRAKKGVFISSSRFSAEALEFASKVEAKIVLIDGEQLANYMIDFGLGVADVASYSVKRIDSDYFIEE